ncbi:hypothetical protein [Schaalia cardiffensis]|uniref:hypothetical protein n=1 Tax=Schaalia cardiffensis TaxID=181487 RepID=UPI0023F1DD91|nr:hypothetical protein [Schaalia cardiffensis]
MNIVLRPGAYELIAHTRTSVWYHRPATGVLVLVAGSLQRPKTVGYSGDRVRNAKAADAGE